MSKFRTIFSLPLFNMILVTGGTGLVGSHILLELLQKGYKIRALKRKTSSLFITEKIFSYYQKSEFLKQIEWIDGDLLDILSLENAINGCNQVIHCAALVSFSPKDAKKMHQFNITGTANIVNTCLRLKVSKLGYISSITALASSSSNQPKTEDSFWKVNDKNSQYSISKYLAEQEVWRGTQEGLDAVIVNPSIILGPGDWSKGSSQLFEKVWEGLKYYTLGSTGYVDVRDVADITVKLMEHTSVNERYILNSENIIYRDLFNSIANHLNKPKPYIKVNPFLKEIAWRLDWIKALISGKSPLITKETANKSMIKNSYSNQKIIQELNHTFIPVEESLKLYCKWFLSEKLNS